MSERAVSAATTPSRPLPEPGIAVDLTPFVAERGPVFALLSRLSGRLIASSLARRATTIRESSCQKEFTG
jgi:hypothetical protein